MYFLFGFASHLLDFAYREAHLLFVLIYLQELHCMVTWYGKWFSEHHGSRFFLFDVEGFGGDTTHGC